MVPPALASALIDAAVEDVLAGSADERLADFVEFLSIPSVGGVPAYDADTRRCAEWIAARLRRAGFPTVDVTPTKRHPVVLAEWNGAPGAPTVIAYCHYDVQPVEPLELWVRPPFEPRLEDGKVFARGATDDKSQLHMHISAAEALLKARGKLPINLKFVFEGEEESGSEHLDDWLEEHRDRLAADLAVVSDGAFFEGNVPAVGYALRGLMYFEIRVSGPNLDLHSGGYGGTVENPAHALARIIASFHDADRHVTVPGFYDDVVPLTDDERAAFARLPFDEAHYREQLGVAELVGEKGFSTLERRWGRPTLDVNGIWGGWTGDGPKTIIPAWVAAKISCRLVAHQDPMRIFELVRKHIAAVTPSTVRSEVTLVNVGKPALTPMDHPAAEEAFAALRDTFGREPVFIREGGTVPVAASFQSLLDLPVVLLGFGVPDGQAHAPNEWMDLGNYETGIRSIVRYWDRLAARSEDVRAPR
jgi:acetylornithine deacetylase/succinyl-diaminopimelate desuccinylase-like protein